MALLEKIHRAELAARQLPQVAFPTRHYRANGMWCREIFMPAGTFVIGRVHTQEHFFMILQGAIQIATEEGHERFAAPGITVSQPGTKRALLILEDATCVTVHRSEAKDVESLLQEIAEPEPDCLYDVHNQLKDPLLNARKLGHP